MTVTPRIIASISEVPKPYHSRYSMLIYIFVAINGVEYHIKSITVPAPRTRYHFHNLRAPHGRERQVNNSSDHNLTANRVGFIQGNQR